MGHAQQKRSSSTPKGEVTPTSWSAGWRPDRGPTGVGGPYAHASTPQSGSVQAGAGLFSGRWGNGAALDVLNANAEAGRMGNEGSVRWGAKADAQMFRGQTPEDWMAGADMGIFDASAEASIGQDGASLGAGANVIDGAVRLGNFDAGRANDASLRIGAGLGVGAGGRLHWGDKDQDGHREYGFGADVGPVSFDLKTEDPLATVLPGASGLIGLGQASGLVGRDFNLTETVGDGIGAAARGIGNAASSAWNWAFGD